MYNRVSTNHKCNKIIIYSFYIMYAIMSIFVVLNRTILLDYYFRLLGLDLELQYLVEEITLIFRVEKPP